MRIGQSLVRTSRVNCAITTNNPSNRQPLCRLPVILVISYQSGCEWSKLCMYDMIDLSKNPWYGAYRCYIGYRKGIPVTHIKVHLYRWHFTILFHQWMLASSDCTEEQGEGNLLYHHKLQKFNSVPFFLQMHQPWFWGWCNVFLQG